MKRIRNDSRSLSSRRVRPRKNEERIEETYFSLLPLEMITIIKDFLEECWKYTLEEALWKKPSIKKYGFEKYTKEITQYGLSITQFFHERRLIRGIDIIGYACENGDVDMYNWVDTVVKAPYCHKLYRSAIRGGQIDMVKYLIERGIKHNRDTMVHNAIIQDDVNILSYVYQFYKPLRNDINSAYQNKSFIVYCHLLNHFKSVPEQTHVDNFNYYLGICPIETIRKFIDIFLLHNLFLERFFDEIARNNRRLPLLRLCEEYGFSITAEYVEYCINVMYENDKEDFYLYLLERCPFSFDQKKNLLKKAILHDHSNMVERLLSENSLPSEDMIVDIIKISKRKDVWEALAMIIDEYIPITERFLIAAIGREQFISGHNYALLVSLHRKKPELIIPNRCFYPFLQNFDGIENAEEFFLYMWNQPRKWKNLNILIALYYGQVNLVRLLADYIPQSFPRMAIKMFIGTLIMDRTKRFRYISRFDAFEEAEVGRLTPFIHSLYGFWKKIENDLHSMIITRSPSNRFSHYIPMNEIAAMLDEENIRFPRFFFRIEKKEPSNKIT